MPIEDVATAVQDHIDRAPDYDLYRDYEEGRHYHPYATEKFIEKFGWILEQARMNACYTVRSNYTDLVQIQAWSGAGADQADSLAQATDLDMVIDLAVNEAFRCGDGFILAWPDSSGAIRPWYHRADQVAFERDPENPGGFLWVAKLWVNGDGYGRVNVYYPDRLERWMTRDKIRLSRDGDPAWRAEGNLFWPADDDDGDTVAYSSVGIEGIPWIHIPFDPQDQGGHGRSVLRDVIPLQDGLNHAVHSIIVNTEKYAAPIRALMNFEAREWIDPETGEAKREQIDLDETRNSIFGIKGPGPLTQLDPPDATKILQVKRDWMTDIAITSGMPVTDISPDLGNVPSGVSLRVLATRRTNTVRAFTKAITGRIGRLLELMGVPDAFPEWIDPAPVDDTERLANAQARLDMGLPLSEVLPDLGESPDDVARILQAVIDQESQMARAGAAAVRAAREDPGVMSGAPES